MRDEPMSAAAFEEQALESIRSQNLLQPGDRVIAAVSGGADSMALLRFFLRRGRELGITLEAAHVNHGLRDAADADEAFVAEFCAKEGVKLHCHRAGRQTERRSEEWARQLRYDFFEQLRKKDPAVKIATAHTLTDQAETLLFRLARGTGLAGAAGIPPVRGPFIRPLLELPRKATEAYCRATGTPFVLDETNESDEYARNRLRNQVLPQLEQINPEAQRALGEYCRRAQGWLQYFRRQGEHLLQTARCGDGWSVSVLQKADPVLRAEALRCLVEEKTTLRQADLPKLEALIEGSSRAAQLAGGVRIERCAGVLRWAQSTEEQPAPPQPAEPGEYRLPGGYRLRLELAEGEECEQIKKFAGGRKKGLTNCVDYDRIRSSLSLRTRQPGDRFQPEGRSGSKSLKKYFNEAGTPGAQRALAPLLAQGSQVVWLWGGGVAQGYAPTNATSRILVIRPLEPTDKEQ